jgi:hypothetical protein
MKMVVFEETVGVSEEPPLRDLPWDPTSLLGMEERNKGVYRVGQGYHVFHYHLSVETIGNRGREGCR